MLSSLASYIWGSGEEESQQQEPQAAEALHRPASPDRAGLKTSPAGDEWVLVDTNSTLSALETSSMENLLIEHPSMSVYVARGRQNSEGAESHHSDSDCDESALPPAAATANRHAVSVRMPPRRPRAVAQRAGLLTPNKRAVQYKTRTCSRTSIQRQNMVRSGPQYACRRSARIVQPSARGQRC